MQKVAVNVLPKNSSLSSVKVRFETLGCRLNQIESEAAASFFTELGFSVQMESLSAKTPGDDNILLFVLNTCAVTQKSEQKARRLIRLMLKNFSNVAVLVTGCYAQLRPKEIASMDKRICVLKGQLKSRIEKAPEILADYLNKCAEWNPSGFAEYLTKEIESLPVEKPDFPENSFKLATDSFIAHSRSSLKIQDGCNNKCSYCTICIARGHSVSLDVQTVLERVKALEKAGQSEIVITTINIGQYKGAWKGGFLNFTELLKLCLEITSKIRFRISSLYPEVVDDEFCNVIKNPRVQPHFHLSVQSGSNTVLEAMNRRYKSADVEEACRRLRLAKENPFIACDLITGFPGETEECFKETMKLAENCAFAWIHAFPYSERPGTAAINFKNKVPQSISGDRAKKLTDFAISSKINYIEENIGKELFAVLELNRAPKTVSFDGTRFRVFHAVTENFLHVEITVPEDEAVKIKKAAVRVKITEIMEENLRKGGELECKGQLV